MGRIQSSIGLVTGTDIVGTVDQLISISARPRDRLVARTSTLQQEQQALAELTASVIGVQLAGNQLANPTTFRSNVAESSNADVVSAVAGNDAIPASYEIKTLQTASTHSIRSLQRFEALDTELGYIGTLRVHPRGGFIDDSAVLSALNGGRGVEPGVIRITDRSGASAEIDLSDVQTITEVLEQINDANIDVHATTVANAIQLRDRSGSALENLQVEQLGDAQTAADLGLWGVDVAGNTATGVEIEIPPGRATLRGAGLSELNGGNGIGPLGSLDITFSDGGSGSIDLSAATSTSEVIDAIASAGLPLLARINDARNGIELRDVSGGAGSTTITSSDTTAEDLKIAGTHDRTVIEGGNLNRQTVTRETLLSNLNQGSGVEGGSFTITDSSGAAGAINLTVDGITTVGQLMDAINDLSIGVTATLNDAGDGIAVVDTAGGTSSLTIEDTGAGTIAADLGIGGTGFVQNVGGSSVEALIGSQAAVIEVEATDTLETLVAKINESGRYASASVEQNDDGTYSLGMRSLKGGESGQIAVVTIGFGLDLKTESVGSDAKISVSTDGGSDRVLSASDGVFEIDAEHSTANQIARSTLLDDIASGADTGSFTVTNSEGVTSAINLAVGRIVTVGGLIDAINDLGIGVSAEMNDAGDGIAVIDSTAGSGALTIQDSGNGNAAASLGISGSATTQTVGGVSVSAIVGPAASESSDTASGLVLTLKQLSEDPIRVTVSEDASTVVSAAQSFVDQYNLLVDKLNSLTFYNVDTEEVGLLFGSSEALRIENGYSRLLSGRIVGAGDLRSIGQVGLRLNDQGKLDLDSSQLTDAIESGGSDVEEFFTTSDTGLADRLSGLADRLAGEGTGMLLNRSETLTSQIEFNNTRIESLNLRLERERERLLRQYYSMEAAIAKIQTNQSAIAQIQPISIPT